MNYIRSDREKRSIEKNKGWKRWKKVVGVMACLVVFCTTYALILPAITLSATISPGEKAEIGSGETVTLVGTEGTNGKPHEWSVNPEGEGCVTLETDGQTATVTGTAAGTVTITHTYYEKKNKTAKEYFYVTVKDSGSSDTGESTKEAGASGYTVTVKGNKKVLTDDVTLHVEDYNKTDADYGSYYDALVSDLKKNAASSETIDESDFAFLHMYHIYLTKQGVEGEYIPEENVNLQVTITYDTKPENWSKVNWVGHYKKNNGTVSGQAISDGSSSSTGVKQIKISGNSITFHIQSFSVFPVVGLSEDSGGGEDGPGGTSADGSILTADHLKWIGVKKSNEWQIVRQKYAGNDSSNKKESDDKTVRVQKNVIPTGTENEFLVYLSIDTKQLFSDYFASATYGATESNSNHDKELGTVVTSVGGNENVQVSGKPVHNNHAIFTILSSTGELLAENITLYWSKANNITMFLKIDDNGVTKYIIVGAKVSKSSNNTIMLSEEAEQLIMSNVAQMASLKNVTDQMGDCIEFESVVAGDYGAEPTYDERTRTLTWIPQIKADPTIDKVKTEESKTVTWTDHDGKLHTETVYKYESWALNVSELVYKVRLDVSKDGFNSAANNMNSEEGDVQSYKVNNSATLTYKDGSIDFQQPYVRGLLYDVEFDKVDGEDTSKKLHDAVFELKDASGSIYTAAEVLDNDGNGTGTYRVENLPWGDYTLTETKAPPGYQISQDNPENGWEISVCYTDNKANLVQDSKKVANMLYIRTDEDASTSRWQIKNDPIYADLIKTDMNYEALAGAEFSIYDTGPPDENAAPMAGYTNIEVGEDGIIADTFKLEPNKTYYIVETKAPDGYNKLADAVQITVGTNGVSAQLKNDNTAQFRIDKPTGDENAYTIYITNSTGYRLPDTGGPGTWIYYLAGGLLILAAGVIYGYSARRKRERRLKF